MYIFLSQLIPFDSSHCPSAKCILYHHARVAQDVSVAAKANINIIYIVCGDLIVVCAVTCKLKTGSKLYQHHEFVGLRNRNRDTELHSQNYMRCTPSICPVHFWFLGGNWCVHFSLFFTFECIHHKYCPSRSDSHERPRTIRSVVQLRTLCAHLTIQICVTWNGHRRANRVHFISPFNVHKNRNWLIFAHLMTATSL